MEEENHVGRWFKLYFDGARVLAEKDLTKNEYRVLFMLLGQIKFGNRLYVNKTRMAKKFNCDRVMISKTMKSLEEKELLVQYGESYKVNNSYVRCGK